jgi:hypothetical protein
MLTTVMRLAVHMEANYRPCWIVRLQWFGLGSYIEGLIFEISSCSQNDIENYDDLSHLCGEEVAYRLS